MGNESSPAKPLRILVAMDFSKQATAALQVARSLAARAGGKVVLCHVRPLADLRAAVAEDRGDLIRGTEEELRAAMETHYRQRLEAVRGPGLDEATRLRRGDPGQELVREAAKGYDLLVVGTTGRGAVTAALLGSTAQDLLHRSPIPVLVVPPDRAR